MIYLDNAATTLYKPNEVYLRSNEVFRLFSANSGRSGHKAALKAAEIVMQTRAAAAEFLGIKNIENIVFTFGCTDALNIAIKGLFYPGDHIITTAYEHNSVLRPLEYLKNTIDIEYSILFPEENGNISPLQIENAIKENTKAVIVNYVSNVTGQVQNIRGISEICKKYGLLFLVDGAQAAGTQELHAQNMGIDYICCAGHKGLYGPQGIGILAINDRSPLPRPLRHGGTGSHSLELIQPKEMPEYLESGTLATQNIAALEKGILFVQENRSKILRHEQELAQLLRDGLADIPGIKIYSPSKMQSGVVAFNIRENDSALVADLLDKQYSIASRGGFHCAPMVHKYLGTETQGAVRLSLSVFNTKKEILTTINAVSEIAQKILL